MGFYLKKRKKILKKLFVGLSLFLIGTLSFLFLSALFKQFSPAHSVLPPLISVLMMTVISLAAYKPLDIAFTQLFKNYLFKNKSYAHMTLMNLAEELALVLDLNELCNLIVNTFGEVLHLKTVAILIPNRFRDDFEIASAYGWHVSDSRRVRLA